MFKYEEESDVQGVVEIAHLPALKIVEDAAKRSIFDTRPLFPPRKLVNHQNFVLGFKIINCFRLECTVSLIAC